MMLTAVVTASIVAVLNSSTRAFSDFSVHTSVRLEARRVLLRVHEQVVLAAPSTVLPVAMSNSSWCAFQPVIGQSSGAAVLGTLVTLRFAISETEEDNGLDDDGNGLIDEGYLEIEQDGVTQRISGKILDLRFNPTATGLECTVDVGGRGTSSTIERTYSISVAFRNSA